MINRTFFWYYNGRYHGKDGWYRQYHQTLNIPWCQVRESDHKNAGHFAFYAHPILNGITSLYTLVEEDLIEPESVSKPPKISSTLVYSHLVYVSWNFVIPWPINLLSMSSCIKNMAIPTLGLPVASTFIRSEHGLFQMLCPVQVKWRAVGMYQVSPVVSREMLSYVDTRLYFYVEMFLMYICLNVWLLFQFTVF